MMKVPPSSLLLLILSLVARSVLPVAGRYVISEDELHAHKLLQENLHVTLNFWQEVRAAKGGRKLTMQNWFKTANSSLKSRFVAFWGIRNNKVVQLDKDGQLRYNNELMMQEGKPNKGAAESMKNSLWLAIEDAANHGVKMPDVMFMYNSADGPHCNVHINCSDGSFAPPISLMSLDADKLFRPPRLSLSRGPPRSYPDLLTPVFKNLGYAQYVSVSPEPHHPSVRKRARLAGHVNPSRHAWHQKVEKLFFRGTRYCPYLVYPVACPREQLTNLSLHHQDKLDVSVFPLTQELWSELKQHGFKGASARAMDGWTRFKYIISIDGLAGSNRVLALLHMGSVVVLQHRSPYLEWFYNSMKPGVHYEEVYKPGPDGKVVPDDAIALVDHLRSNDAHARSIAQNGLAFAQTYLTKEIMLIYLRELLTSYKGLFEDMDDYMSRFPDMGSPTTFLQHVREWKQEPWRVV